MKHYIYLCGQITGLSYDEARFGWREQVMKAFEGSVVQPLSPMRAKAHLAGVRSLSEFGDPASVLSCPRGLTSRDYLDVKRSTLIFCNVLGMERVSVGSMIEFGWANALRIPIVCCIEPEGNPHDHAMVQELINWRCSSLEEGIEVARAIFSEGL